uniref:WD repeat-containing protein 63 n=1 Tax=Haptolina brevifila TaxID=156173 RepID=A0A7S2JAQ3_9EUKA|mmetsp:Transcript_78708/g.156508  ORF Transcript_78708/g.156508 Transcript_78708/m.156508 type:complete len:809 (+) Transcript_78708:127-2553(+)
MPEWEGATVEVPAGVYPLFLTGATQEGFGLQHCTVDDPYRMIPKADLLAEIQFKGAISDFSVTKKHIEKYPNDEMLVCLDDDEIYGQNFFLCISVQEADRVMAEQAAKAPPPKAKAAPGADDAAGAVEEEEEEWVEPPYVPPVSKPWVSQGSEAEIEEEAVRPTRDLFILSMVRKRREFGAAFKFSDRDAQEDPNLTQNDCRPYKDPNFELRRKEHDIAVQACAEVSDAKTQTNWFRPMNKALQHEYISMETRQELEALDSGAMRHFLKEINPRLEEALQQNETVDIFADDFADLAEEDAALGNKNDAELKELQSYYHLHYCAGRKLAFIQWQPQAKGVVAVAGARNMAFDERVAVAGKVHTGYVLLWNFSDPINPQFVLEAPGDIYCFRFNPSNPDLVIGGLESGQVALWNLADARAAAREAKVLHDDSNEEGGNNTITAKATVLSAVDQSHRRTITDLTWLPIGLDVSEKGKFVRRPSESTVEEKFLSVAGDGMILFWDLKKSVEVPEEKKEDTGKKASKEGWGPTAKMTVLNPDGGIELSPIHALLDVSDDVKGPVRLYTATEEGEFSMIELLDPSTENFSKGVRTVIPAHTGPCVSLRRSPFVPQIYLSIGDWTFNLWKEGVGSPLFVSPFCNCLYTCGAWSPSRPAVIFIGRSDGFIDIWDLNDRSHEPSMMVSATPAAVTSMDFHTSANRQMLAVGDEQGTVHVVEVPRNLRRAANNEKQFANNFFRREEERVEYVQRRSEQHAEDKESGGGSHEPTGSAEPKEGELTEEERLEADFRKMEEAFVEEMGLGAQPPAPAPADD